MKTLEKNSAAKATTKQKSTKLVSIRRHEEKITRKWVYAKLMVPAAFAELLAKPGFCAPTEAASVWEGLEESRIRNWNNRHRINSGWLKPRKTNLEAILGMELDTVITMAFPATEWGRIQTVCTALEISACDWLLAAVHYRATLELERRDEAVVA